MVAGVTWLAVIGGVLSSYILINAGAAGHSHSNPSYAAYDTLEPAPTSFGTVKVTRADMVSSEASVNVDVSMFVANTGDAQADAPRIEDLRLVNSYGEDLNTAPIKWSGPSVVVAHSTATVDLNFQAPRHAGLMWLEYRDPYGQWPIRIVLGTADPPQAAGLGGSF
jgi:hypothetical protein